MGELHPLLDTFTSKSDDEWRGRAVGVAWRLFRGRSGAWTPSYICADRETDLDPCDSAEEGAQALCEQCPELRSWLASLEQPRPPKVSPTQEAGRVFRGKTYSTPTDDPDDLTTDWTTIVAAKDADLEESARMVSAREGAIERAIEALTGERHTYGDQSADMLLAEAGRAMDRASRWAAKARQAADAAIAEASRMDVRCHCSTVALRAVVEALSPAGFRLESDRGLETAALDKALWAGRRIERLEREVDRLRAASPANTSDATPF